MIINKFKFNVSGINIFLDGFVPTENLRFRETSLTFKVAETAMEEEIKRMCRYEYPKMTKNLGMSHGLVKHCTIVSILGEKYMVKKYLHVIW